MDPTTTKRPCTAHEWQEAGVDLLGTVPYECVVGSLLVLLSPRDLCCLSRTSRQAALLTRAAHLRGAVHSLDYRECCADRDVHGVALCSAAAFLGPLLQEIVVDHSVVTEEALCTLALTCPGLQRLSFVESLFRLEVVRSGAFSNLVMLKIIVRCQGDIRDSDEESIVAAIATACPALEEIVVGRSTVTEEALFTLSLVCPALRRLSIVECEPRELSADGCKALGQACGHCLQHAQLMDCYPDHVTGFLEGLLASEHRGALPLTSLVTDLLYLEDLRSMFAIPGAFANLVKLKVMPPCDECCEDDEDGDHCAVATIACTASGSALSG
eukprot:m51a1_g6042 hypothetical protein (327) ;mRNA; r:170340-173409